MLRLTGFSVSFLTLLALLSGCAEADETLVDEAASEVVAAPEALQVAEAAGGLARGKREVLVANIPTAENLLFLSDGRLLVTGDKGLYLLSRSASGKVEAKNLKPSEPCAFGGLVEVGGVVYANCYDFTKASIYATKLGTLDFKPIAPLANTLIANSLTTDGRHLYVSATLQSKIVRLTIDPSNPLALTGQKDFVSGAAASALPNGTKVHGDTLYWNDLFAIKAVGLDGRGTPRTVATQLSLFDDLYVDKGGIIVCDYLANALRAYDLSGKKLGETKAVFQAPSAVVPARGRLGLGQHDFVVTERGGGVVSVYRVGS